MDYRDTRAYILDPCIQEIFQIENSYLGIASVTLIFDVSRTNELRKLNSTYNDSILARMNECVYIHWNLKRPLQI